MLFSSITFLYYFLPLTMVVYWILPFKLKNIFCLLASLFFYAWGEPTYIFLMLGSIAVNFLFGLLIGEVKKYSKIFLVFSLIFNIGLLIVFKYLGFILDNLAIFSFLNLPETDIRLPLGISFFTFQAVSYIIDVYREDTKAQNSLIKLGLYIFAFPQLIAGPIVRYNTIIDQIEDRNINLEKIANGIFRFSVGLGKKILLANKFGGIANSIMKADSIPASPISAWIGIISYSFQIFYDFSGYSDMAIGLGKMLGFEYEENFDYPYTAGSISEFWRRWHISLSQWFRDYVYIPLGGSRAGKSNHIRNLLVVWTLTGLWHGAQWTFLAWGLYYFALLYLENFVIKEKIEKIPYIIRNIITMILVMIGWLIFSSENLLYFVKYFLSLFGILRGYLKIEYLIIIHDYKLLFILGLILSRPVMRRIIEAIKNRYENLYILVETIFSIGLLSLSSIYLVNSTYNPFIYFRF